MDDSVRPPAGLGIADRESRGVTGATAPRGSLTVVRVEPLGRLGAGTCPNLLQRRLFSGVMAVLSCLDHLSSVGPLKCRWTTWFTKYGGPTERKWSNRTQVVQAGRPRHDMRDAVPPCGTRRRGGAGTGGRRNRPRSTRSAPDDRPADPVAPDSPRRARRRLGRVITTGPAPQRP